MIYIIVSIIFSFLFSFLIYKKFYRKIKNNVSTNSIFIDELIETLENNSFGKILGIILEKLQNKDDERITCIQGFKQYRDLFVKNISENLVDCKQYLKLLDDLQEKNNAYNQTKKRLDQIVIKMNVILQENKKNVYDLMNVKKVLLEEKIAELTVEIKSIQQKLQEIIVKLGIEEVEKLRTKQNIYIKQMGKSSKDIGDQYEDIVYDYYKNEITDPSIKIIRNVKIRDKVQNIFAEFDLMVVKLDEQDPINKPVKVLKVIEIKHNVNDITEAFYQHKKQLEIISKSDKTIKGFSDNQAYNFSKLSFEGFEITKYLHFAVSYSDDFIITPYSSKIVNQIISKITTIPSIEDVYCKMLVDKQENLVFNQDFDIAKLIETKDITQLDVKSKQILDTLISMLVKDPENGIISILKLYKNNGYSDHIIKIDMIM